MIVSLKKKYLNTTVYQNFPNQYRLNPVFAPDGTLKQICVHAALWQQLYNYDLILETDTKFLLIESDGLYHTFPESEAQDEGY